MLLFGLLSDASTAHAQAPPAADTPAADTPAEGSPTEGGPDDGEAEGTGGDAPADDASAAGAAGDAAEGEIVIEETESPWSTGLITSMFALLLGGLSAVLGIWVDRDKKRPVIFAVVMSILITTAIGVGISQSYLDAIGAIQQKQDLERMLTMVSEIAASSGDESLVALLESEGADVTVAPQEAPAEAPTGEEGSNTPEDGEAAPASE